jgi:hypothetical protein
MTMTPTRMSAADEVEAPDDGDAEERRVGEQGAARVAGRRRRGRPAGLRRRRTSGRVESRLGHATMPSAVRRGSLSLTTIPTTRSCITISGYLVARPPLSPA